jgi:tetratricopeptide (TPR) repeat protein
MLLVADQLEPSWQRCLSGCTKHEGIGATEPQQKQQWGLNKRDMKHQRFFFSLVGIMVVSFALLLASGCASKEEKKAKHLKNAKEYIAKNELKKAVIELKNVVQLDPKDDAAYLELGEAYLKLRDPREAFQAYRRAASVNPGNLRGQLKLGQMLLLGRRTDEAKKKAELILAKSPEDVDALSLLSGVQVQQRDLDGAISTLEKAASLNPNHFSTQLSLGRLLFLKGEPAKAEECYLKAIALDPASSVPYIELSRIYAGKGELDKAEAELKRMIRTSGSTDETLHVLALFYESTKKFDQAEKTYLQAVEAAPQGNVTALMNLAAYYARMKSYDRALDAMQKAAEIKPDDPNVLVSIAELQFDFNKVKEAEATVDKVLEKESGHVGANLLKGRILLTRRDSGSAIERFNVVVKEGPRNSMGYYFRGLAYIGKGDPKMGQQDLVKAVEFNPGLLEARLILSEVYLNERNADLARQQIEVAMKIAPRNTRVLMHQASLKVLEKDLKGAEDIYGKIIQADADYAPAYVQLGLIYNLTNRQPDALKSFNKALALNPQQTDALALVVGLNVRDKKYDEAMKACEGQKIKVKDSPASLSLIEYLEGNILVAKNNSKAAQDRFKKAIEIEPSNPAAYVALAQTYAREKQFDEAIREYEGVIARNHEYLAGYMAVGTIYDQKGDAKKAETYYRKALDIKRDFGPAANNLAWKLAEKGGNIDEALTFAQIAKEQLPNSPAVMDTLGYVYYLKGSYLNAIAEYQDSLARDPENAVINYHMGLAQYKNTDKAKAKDFLEKALQLDPNFQGADDARRILKEIAG